MAADGLGHGTEHSRCARIGSNLVGDEHGDVVDARHFGQRGQVVIQPAESRKMQQSRSNKHSGVLVCDKLSNGTGGAGQSARYTIAVARRARRVRCSRRGRGWWPNR